MKSIVIHNIPETVYAVLEEMAPKSHCSLQEQVKPILEQKVNLIDRSSLASAAEWRDRLNGRRFSDTVEMIRKFRGRDE